MNNPTAQLRCPSRVIPLDRWATLTPDQVRTAELLEGCRAGLPSSLDLGPRVSYFAGSRERIAL